MSNFTRNVFLASFVLSGLITNAVKEVAQRHPAAFEEGYELTLQNLTANTGSKLENLKDVYVRAIVNNQHIVEFGRDQKWSVAGGETKRIDQKLEIKAPWISQDGLEFRLEVVHAGLFETVLLRCSTISKGLSVYNRAYQCAVPGEQAPVLSYRVAKKGAPLPDSSNGLAQVNFSK